LAGEKKERGLDKQFASRREKGQLPGVVKNKKKDHSLWRKGGGGKKVRNLKVGEL